jgi:hypothetical protein
VFAADSSTFPPVNKRKLQFNREVFIDAAIERPRVNERFHHLKR